MSAERNSRKARFLAVLAAGHSVTEAAEAAGTPRRTLYRWRDSDADFAADWLDASEAGADRIEDEAFRRAVIGTEKPVYRGGEVIGHVTEYSDSMLSMLLKARRPEKYGTTAAGTGSAPDIEGARDALFRKFAQATDGGKAD